MSWDPNLWLPKVAPGPKAPPKPRAVDTRWDAFWRKARGAGAVAKNVLDLRDEYMTAWEKGRPGWTKLLNALELGGFAAPDALRLMSVPKFWAGSGVRFLTIPGTDIQTLPRGPSARPPLPVPQDMLKAYNFALPRLTAAFRRDPNVAAPLRKQQGFIMRSFYDLLPSPTAWLGARAPLGFGVQKGLRGAGVIARRTAAVLPPAIERGVTRAYRAAAPLVERARTKAEPIVARLAPPSSLAGRAASSVAELLRSLPQRVRDANVILSRSGVRPLARLPDEELQNLWHLTGASIREAGAIKPIAMREVRSLLKGSTNDEIMDAFWCLGKAEDLPVLKKLIASGAVQPKTARTLELYGKLRGLTRRAYEQIPAEKRFPVAVTPTGERVITEVPTRKVLDPKTGKLLGFRRVNPDGSLGDWITPYRKAYAPTKGPPPTPVQRAAGAIKRAVVPASRLPRRLPSEAERLSRKQVFDRLTKMLAAERYDPLDIATKKLFARLVARASQPGALPSAHVVENALDATYRLYRQYGPRKIRTALTTADQILVGTPKRMLTLFRPAWYLLNAFDSLIFKNLVSGVPSGRLFRYAFRLPVDYAGNPRNYGGAMAQEMGHKHAGFIKSWLGRLANWTENCARNARGAETYWREIDAARLRGTSPAAAHSRAFAAANTAVKNIHFDYDDLSIFDQVFRRIYPFLVYQTNQIGFVTRLVVDNPRFARFAYEGVSTGIKLNLGQVGLIHTLEIDITDIWSIRRLGRTAAEGRLWRSDKAPETIAEWIVEPLQALGISLHPVGEQVLASKPLNLLDDKSWKTLTPALDTLAKTTGRDLTARGVAILFAPPSGVPRTFGFEQALARRSFERRAYSILEKKPMSHRQCDLWATREAQLAALLNSLGYYPKVREPMYDEMKALEERYKAVPFAHRDEFLTENPALQIWLASRRRL